MLQSNLSGLLLEYYDRQTVTMPHGTDIQEPCSYLVPDFDFSQEWIVDE